MNVVPETSRDIPFGPSTLWHPTGWPSKAFLPLSDEKGAHLIINASLLAQGFRWCSLLQVQGIQAAGHHAQEVNKHDSYGSFNHKSILNSLLSPA
jgi:hypothetical protein